MSTRAARTRRRYRRRDELLLVTIGGLSLAGSAGFVNVVVIAAGGIPATHVTGTVSRLSADLGALDVIDARRVLFLLAAFAGGAAVSGLLLAGQSLRPGRRYGVVTLLEALVLAAATLTIRDAPLTGTLLAAAAAGMQNAMASTYSGLIVRTTHVTGILTDLGFLAGAAIRGERAELWRFALLTALLLSFFGGGFAGVEAWGALGADALWIPAALLFAMGSVYFAWRQRLTRRQRARQSERLTPSQTAAASAPRR